MVYFESLKQFSGQVATLRLGHKATVATCPLVVIFVDFNFVLLSADYQKKIQRAAYGSDNLRAALQELQEEKSLRSVSKKYGISTRRLASHRDGKVNAPGVINLGNSARALSDEVETEISKHVLEMLKRMFGLTTFDVRKLAYDVAV